MKTLSQKGLSIPIIILITVVILLAGGMLRWSLYDRQDNKETRGNYGINYDSLYFVTNRFDKDSDNNIFQISEVDSHSEYDDYNIIKDKWTVLNDVKINIDNSITFIETHSEYNKTSVKDLVKINISNKNELQRMNLFNPESGIRIAELDQSEYLLTDRNAGRFMLVNPNIFNKTEIVIDEEVSSSYWTPGVKKILYTTYELDNENRTNMYILDPETESVQPIFHSGSGFILYEFFPYSTRLTNPCQYDLNQQTWSRYNKYYSSNEKYLALGQCDRILLLDVDGRSINTIIENEMPILLGWLDDEQILVRLKNNTGDYKIVALNVFTGDMHKIVPEDFYWDMYWSISPDKLKIVYSAISTSLSSMESCGYFSSGDASCHRKVDLYLIDLENKTRTQIASYSSADYHSPIWSIDSNYFLINMKSDKYECIVYNANLHEEVDKRVGECVGWVN